ncbi:START domain containing 10, isoform CRA_a [Rattus norvegicus]|uniref:START domain containing 10, isoform CRA_a n=1 Tax=Rattus norvegicus TaxID=10116 RepID=A6I6U1_RAT|nr:START domain containing 10, isoform CRA_a [Rattus norvegicus]
MEKPAASTEPQGPRPALGRESVQVPDDQDFRSFRSECEAEVGWNLTYSKAGVSVWVQAVEMDRTLHKIKCRMECCDVPAETLYDVLHDIEYRKKWDSNVIETFDIARLTVNADVGYYSWRCPKPLKNRDVITLRSWLPMGADYIIMNYSVKHPGKGKIPTSERLGPSCVHPDGLPHPEHGAQELCHHLPGPSGPQRLLTQVGGE